MNRRAVLVSAASLAAGLGATALARDSIHAQELATPVSSGPPVTGNGQTVELNGIQLYYEVHGEGFPLILVHGGLGNVDYWSNQIPVFAETYQVIALDSRGHGRSTFNETPISYEVMGNDILALMDHLEIDKADLVGWSDGGILGLELAIKHPERMNRIVAYAANYTPAGVRLDIGTSVKFNEYIAIAAADYQKLSPAPEKWNAFLANIGNMWATEPNYSKAQLEGITTPILILDGGQEEAIDLAQTLEMAELIPGAELVLIAGTGHFAFWEKAEQFDQIVLDFLAG